MIDYDASKRCLKLRNKFSNVFLTKKSSVGAKPEPKMLLESLTVSPGREPLRQEKYKHNDSSSSLRFF